VEGKKKGGGPSAFLQKADQSRRPESQKQRAEKKKKKKDTFVFLKESPRGWKKGERGDHSYPGGETPTLKEALA